MKDMMRAEQYSISVKACNERFHPSATQPYRADAYT